MEERRSAGILLHITSLPGQFGTGDIGPEAFAFAEFLQQAGQRYWQILPLNPVDASTAFSPYSSISSMAGNTLLISPDRLEAEGLLEKGELKKHSIKSGPKADFEEAQHIKTILLARAFERFKQSRRSTHRQFNQFCTREQQWLDDYAMYVHLKQLHQGQPWNAWSNSLRKRDRVELATIAKDSAAQLEKIKWEQFVFFSQWQQLRKWCNGKGIRLFGDLPFYVSYDSADVWSTPEIFMLDRNGSPKFVAGVPPDYFNEDGQLWGMPVFNWPRIKATEYSWWVERLRKNIQLFDLLRLDHFRAFAGYWSIPASESTAKNGKWKTGPGAPLFEAVEAAVGELPFVAEDLGDIDDSVRDLRSTWRFPGMKVLHFAFDDNMAQSEYIPHHYGRNFIAYTGTHDNNTTRGWYRRDLKPAQRSNLEKYSGQPVNEKNVHTVMIRLAYASVARIAMVPAQDVLGLDEKSRFNSPATVKNNWLWRLQKNELTGKHAAWLRAQAKLYDR